MLLGPIVWRLPGTFVLAALTATVSQAHAQPRSTPGYAPPSYAPPGYAPPGYAPPGYAPPGYAPPGYALPPPPPLPPEDADPDPLLVTSAPGLFLGGLVGLGSALGLAADRSPSSGWSGPLLAGGATTLAGSLVMLGGSLASPPTHADAGRARLGAGGMVFSLGAGLLATGLGGKATDVKREPANVLVAAGTGSMVVAAPWMIWGAATWGDDAAPPGWAPTRFASPSSMVAGTVLLSAGVLTTTGAFVAFTNPSECGGPCPEQLGGGALLALGIAGFAVGLPLYASGADVERRVWPRLTFGATAVQATWELDGGAGRARAASPRGR